MPFIGNKNIFLKNLIGATMFLAVYKVLKREGKPIEEIGKIVYEVSEAQFEGCPKWMRSLIGAMYFNRFSTF